MAATAPPRAPRLSAVRREGEARVTPLELFFDLVFVLALTQCTALMADAAAVLRARPITECRSPRSALLASTKSRIWPARNAV